MKFAKLPLERRVENYLPKYKKYVELGQRPPFFDRLFRPYTIAGCRIQEKCINGNATEQQVLENMQEMAFRLKLEWDVPGKPKLTIEWVSPAYERVLGFSQESAIGRNILQNVHPDDVAGVMKIISGKVLTKEGGYAKFRSIKADGTYIWVEGTGTPILDKKGNVAGGVIVSRDITDRVAAEAELMAAKNALVEKEAKTSRLLSIIIHDVRSAISSVIGFSEMLIDGNAETQEEASKWIQIIFNSAKKGVNIINDVVLWRESGQIDAKPVMFDVGKVVDENVLMFQRVAYDKKLDITNDIRLGDVLAFADENMVSQIVQNLISNATKFTPKGGKVLVSAKRTGQTVEISVADTGIGMRPEMVAALFNIEKTFTTPGTENEVGTGFGLTIVHELVDKNKGSIRVQSEVGKGTTFTVTLPAAQG